MQEKVWKIDKETGLLKLRSGVVVAFFLPAPIDSVVTQIRSALEDYLKRLPPDVLRWSSVGAGSEEWRAVNKNTFRRCFDQLDAEAARKRSLTYFELRDGEQAGDAPGYGVLVLGNRVDPDFPNERGVVQFHYPSDVLEPDLLESFVADMVSMAETLPFISGYASPALFCASPEAWREARATVKRYPGYDLQDNSNGCSEIADRVRGARWLTFLGPELVKELGGPVKVRRSLPEPITVTPVGHGLMVRTSIAPDLFDVSRNPDISSMKALAELLEPVTLFDEGAIYCTEFAGQDDDLLRHWERRFLDI
jgi:hypothetical protein